MNDREDIDMLAAEFILGTLTNSERTEVAARRLREPELDRAIDDWERRLSPLNDYVLDAAPNPVLLNNVLARIGSSETPRIASVQLAREVDRLRARVGLWRYAAIAASILAVALAGFIGLNRHLLQSPQQSFVAVFNEGDQQPLFLLSIDLATKQLTIRPVAAKSDPNKSYQLWMVSERWGSDPKSLGLLDNVDRVTNKPLPMSDRALLTRATFGISLEPKGGSPTGKPTGPAVHGKLLPASE